MSEFLIEFKQFVFSEEDGEDNEVLSEQVPVEHADDLSTPRASTPPAPRMKIRYPPSFIDAFVALATVKGVAYAREVSQPQPPRATAYRWVSRRGTLKSPGAPTILSQADEKSLVKWLNMMGNAGFAVDGKLIKSFVSFHTRMFLSLD